MSNSLISLMDVKQALRDSRFRDSLPESFKDDIVKYLQNPSCACNLPIYNRILEHGSKQLLDYFPGKEMPKTGIKQQNQWSVINCHHKELEARLAKLPPGRKHIAIARYEDQVTVVVNDLDVF